MAFELNSKIKIGDYTFTGGVNDLIIKKSVHVIVDTAQLKIPTLGRVISRSNPDKVIYGSVETAGLFKEGDKVAIDLGYNGDLRNEFRGFVRRVTPDTPMVIDMEGYAWQLRNAPAINQSWKATTVKEVLQVVIKGTDIVLDASIPEIKLTNFHLRNVDALKVLEYLKDKLLLTVCFDDNVLYAGIEEAIIKGTVKYNIGFNTIKTNELKRRLASDTKVRVRLKTKGKDGKHVLYEAGDEGGAWVDRIIPYSNDQTYLKNMADEYLKKLKYTGFEGKLQGFLQPFAKPGYRAVIGDPRSGNARAGVYFIPSVEVRFGAKGGRRACEIKYRLND